MPILRYIHATKQFAPDAYGVMDVNFEVEPGELVVITGHTGSGKTTLMKLLTREYSLTEGELYFNDTPVHDLKSSKVHLHRRQIGVVYQDYRLIKDLTAWENVALPLYITGKKEDEVEQRVSDLLNLIKLTDKHDLFPSQLSGGEAQRVSIARSLALAPELIFADEPTGNLDTDTSKMIALLLAKINELGTTVLLSTHDLTLLDVFTKERHVQLEKGAIVKDSGSRRTTAPHSTVTPSAAPEEPVDSKSVTSAATDAAPIALEVTTTSTVQTALPTETTTPPTKKSLWHILSLIGRKPPQETKDGSPAVVEQKAAANQPETEPDTPKKATKPTLAKPKKSEPKPRQAVKAHHNKE